MVLKINKQQRLGARFIKEGSAYIENYIAKYLGNFCWKTFVFSVYLQYASEKLWTVEKIEEKRIF